MKKKLICFLTMLLLQCCINIGYAEDEGVDRVVYAMNSHLVLAGEQVMDILPEPFIYKGVSYVPVRYTASIFGGAVNYNVSDNSVSVLYDGRTVNISLSSCIYKYDVSYLPVRDITLKLGLHVFWDNGILLISKENTPDELTEKKDVYIKQLAYSGHFDVFEEEEYQKLEKKVSFSVEAGCYNEGIILELSTNIRRGVIHYTTDGSIPTQESPIYSGPIAIDDRTYAPNVAAEVPWVVDGGFVYPTGPVQKGTVIRARAFNDAGEKTPIAVNTYFIGLDLKQRYGVKVLSISVPFEDMFDRETGIYNYMNSITLSNREERQAFLEIWDESNARVIAQPVGIRLNGASSRLLQQKSLRIYARKNEEYENGDKKNIKYDLFDGKVRDINDKTVTKYKRFILRNGGNDWSEYFMKDALVQKLCRPLNVEIQESSNSVVFVNGEYFGFYRLRERYDDEYFQYHYDLKDEKDAVIIEIANNPKVANLNEGVPTDLEDFNGKVYFVINNDMSNDANYKIAESYFDMGSFLDYYILNVFFENVDWPHNNVKLWRNKNPENGDTRYRFMVSDEDTTLRELGKIYAQAYGAKSDLARLWTKKKSTGTLGYKIERIDCLLNWAFNSLMKNYNFKMDFIRRYNDYLNTVFSSMNVITNAREFFYGAVSLRDEQRVRYPGSWKKSDINDIIVWATSRQIKARSELENYFGIKNKADVNFKSNLEQGYICTNSIQLRAGSEFGITNPENYTSSYYLNVPLWFKAVPNYGYELDYFLVNEQPWTSSSEYVINVAGNTSIEAVFKPVQQ